MTDRPVIFRRLVWVGPATVATSVVAVKLVQRALHGVLSPLPPFSESIVTSNEPATVTALLVTAAVLAFAILGRASSSPVAAFQRLASGALIVSFLPNVVAALVIAQAGWTGMLALAVLHIVAWAITVMMLTQLATGRVQRTEHIGN